MKPIYAGSVKTLYPDADPAYVWFEYTDDYSVFDWGKMPDPIPGKGEASRASASSSSASWRIPGAGRRSA